MLILVLGASSYVGASLAEAFCVNNGILLVGRNVGKLMTVADSCRHLGATQVDYIEEDFSLGVDSLLKAIKRKHIDLIIDAASASSSKRDLEIKSNDILDLVTCDFSSRTKIMDHILHSQEVAPAVIFISTVLALLKSPGRTVYTALKQLYEIYLVKLKNNHPELELFVVYVGTTIDARKRIEQTETTCCSGFQGVQE